MPNTVNISLTNTFEEWRVKDNEIGAALGDLDNINSNAKTGEDTVVATLNNLRTETTNNAGWIGDISTLFDGYGNVVAAANNSDTRLNTKDTEQGAITGLTHYATYPTLVGTLNSHDSRLDTAETNIGTIGDIDSTLSTTNLVGAVNANKDFIDQISAASGISLTTTFGDVYNGTQTSVSGALNNDYARLNKINGLIGGTQTNGTTVDFASADLYGTHTNLVSAINGIEDFVLTNSKWDGTNDKSLIWALNNHESRLDTEESNVDALQVDLGTWSTYENLMAANSWTEGNITDAIIDIRNRQDNLTGDFVNASGDTLTGNLNFTTGGVQATGQYLNIGVGGTNTIRINTSNRVGVGKAAHSSYKFDVSGTLNATDLKIGGESLDDRFLEVNTVSSWDEIGAQVKFNNNTTFADEVKLGTKVIYNSLLSFDEVVQDISGGMFTSNTESGGVWASYSDSTGKVTLGITDDGHNHVWSNIDNATETVQDIIGNMIINNSESGIAVTYDDVDGTLDFNVNDPVITLTGDVTGSATMSNLGSVSIATTVSANNVALGTDTTGNYVKKGSTSGSGISGSVDSEGGTFTVSSNATSGNTANTIVYRDASRNFSANNITVNTMSSSSVSTGSISCDAITANGAITVNANDNASYIYMHDSDHGSRTIHCNSNNIGFLNQAGSWSSYADDTGNWRCAFDIYADGGDMYASTFHGNASTANYADLAENYRADQEYEVGTVLSFGGSWEVTQSNKKVDTRIAGVVSTEPAYLMNADQQGEFVTPVALMGRVPCKVQGDIRKGDMLVSAGNGRARVVDTPLMGSVIGKALADSDGDNIIEVVVGKL